MDYRYSGSLGRFFGSATNAPTNIAGLIALLLTIASDFSVVLFRPNFMLAFEEHSVKVHKNQWLSTCYLPLLSLVEPRTKAHTMESGVQTPSQ
jgi:hypothetical protein